MKVNDKVRIVGGSWSNRVGIVLISEPELCIIRLADGTEVPVRPNQLILVVGSGLGLKPS